MPDPGPGGRRGPPLPPPAASGAAPAPEAWDWVARNPKAARFFSSIWLVYLVYPLIPLLGPHLSPVVRIAGLLGLALFVATYVAAWSGATWGTTRLPQALGLAFALACVLTAALGSDFVGLFIFLVPTAARLRSFRVALAAAAVDTAACIAANVALHAGMGTVLAMGAICAMSGLTVFGTRHLVSTAGDLRAAREEVARLAIVDERLRIARDMHDLLGRSLAVIALKSDLAARLVGVDPERAAAEIADVQAVARRSLAEVREVVAGYHRPRLDEELARAAAGLAAAGIRCSHVQTAGDLPEPAAVVVAWAVREAATNVLKHSQARTCRISISRSAGLVAAVVEDDGRGPPAVGNQRTGGTGLTGLADRVRAAGGELWTGRAGLGGFRVEVRVPTGDAPTPSSSVGAPGGGEAGVGQEVRPPQHG